MGTKLTLSNYWILSPEDCAIDDSWPEGKSDLNLI